LIVLVIPCRFTGIEIGIGIEIQFFRNSFGQNSLPEFCAAGGVKMYQSRRF